MEVQELKALDVYAAQQPTLRSAIRNTLHRLETVPNRLITFNKFLNNNAETADVENYLRNLHEYIASKYNKVKIEEEVKSSANVVNETKAATTLASMASAKFRTSMAFLALWMVWATRSSRN